MLKLWQSHPVSSSLNSSTLRSKIHVLLDIDVLMPIIITWLPYLLKKQIQSFPRSPRFCVISDPIQSQMHHPSTLTSPVSLLSPLLCAALHPALASLLTGVHAKCAFTAGSLPVLSPRLAILPYIHKHISFLHSCRFLLKSSHFIKISFQHTHIHSRSQLFFCHITLLNFSSQLYHHLKLYIYMYVCIYVYMTV